MGFANLAKALHSTLLSAEGECVSYTSVIGLNAIVSGIQASTSHEVPSEHGVLISTKSKDFLIKVDALSEHGIYKVRKGDLIELDGITYKVLPFTAEGNFYEFSDHSEGLYRIFTKKVKV